MLWRPFTPGGARDPHLGFRKILEADPFLYLYMSMLVLGFSGSVRPRLICSGPKRSRLGRQVFPESPRSKVSSILEPVTKADAQMLAVSEIFQANDREGSHPSPGSLV